MSAATLFDNDPELRPSPIFKLCVPPDWDSSSVSNDRFSTLNPRITNPGAFQKSPKELLEQLRDGDKPDVPEVTPDERDYFRERGSTVEFYEKILAPWRRRQCARGEVAPGTLTNERQSVKCFAEFDLSSRPAEWPIGEPWEGRPMGYLVPGYIREWLAYRLRFGTKKGPLSTGSIPKRWNHLRFIINQAFRLRIVPDQLSLSVDQLIDEYQIETEGDCLDLDLVPTSFTEPQLDAVYQELDGDLELQTAWVVGAFVGPRTGDLFSLRWQRNVRLDVSPPDVIYLAQKTKRKRRRIWVPLGPIAIDHLKRLAKQQAHLAEPQGLVFPRLTDGQRKDPEDGERSKARTRRIKAAIADAGIVATVDTDRPWQMLRSTANTRLNECETAAGNRATHGQEASTQGVFYTDYRDMLIGAVMQLDRRRTEQGVFCKRP